jgi:hypothetical protein
MAESSRGAILPAAWTPLHFKYGISKFLLILQKAASATMTVERFTRSS